jgi:hypothetical protein
MWPHFKSLLWNSFLYYPAIFSGNWFTVGVLPPLAFLFAERDNLRRLRTMTSAELKKAVRNGGILAAFYVALFCWAIVHTVYQDHQDLVASKRSERGALNDANRRLDSLTMPNLSGKIESTLTAPTGEGNKATLLTAIASIRNLGAPTILYGWDASLKLKDGRIVPGRMVPMPAEGLVRLGIGPSDDYVIREYVADHLFVKTSDHPITQGGGATGWMQVLFDVPTSEVALSTLSIMFSDINAKPHTLTCDMQKGVPASPLSLGKGELRQDESDRPKAHQ